MYKVPQQINPNKIFIIRRSELEERLEPKFYTGIYTENEKLIDNSIYQIHHLSEVTSMISDGTHFTPKYQDKGVKFVSVKDVRPSLISLTDTKFISEEEADELDKRCKPEINDVLVTKIGTIGLASVVETTERFQIFVSVALLRPRKNILSKYLEIYINSNFYFADIL